MNVPNWCESETDTYEKLWSCDDLNLVLYLHDLCGKMEIGGSR